MAKQLGIAVIGYGGMGDFHVQNLWNFEDYKDLYKPIGVHDIDQKAKEKAIKNGLEVFETRQDLLNDPRVDVVLIATTNPFHAPYSIEALKAGKHVICEKPVTLSVQEFDNIVKVANETGNKFMVHQNRRWDPDFMIINEIYKNKKIGDIFEIESRVGGANWVPEGWRSNKEEGGGMLLDWGVHLIDQMLYMTKGLKLKKVFADISYRIIGEVDDGFYAYFIFDNGLRAVIDIQTSNYTQLARWFVKGTKGTGVLGRGDADWGSRDVKIDLIIDSGITTEPPAVKMGAGLTKTMAPLSQDAKTQESYGPAIQPYPWFYQNFYDMVVNNAEPLIKHEENRRVLQLFNAIRESSDNQKVVDFE